ncbi:hypothetical protein SNEBB_008034 [Seison nebaliae]|nr:hypothetical protein SNEBB_008034 [Seison nebaliae]
MYSKASYFWIVYLLLAISIHNATQYSFPSIKRFTGQYKCLSPGEKCDISSECCEGEACVLTPNTSPAQKGTCMTLKEYSLQGFNEPPKVHIGGQHRNVEVNGRECRWNQDCSAGYCCHGHYAFRQAPKLTCQRQAEGSCDKEFDFLLDGDEWF